jgi:hypothetical protein
MASPGDLLGSRVDVKRLSPSGRASRAAFGGRTAQGVSIQISTTPAASDLAFNLEAHADMLKDFRPLWQDIRELFNRHQSRHFDTEGAATGKKWPDNSAPSVPIVPGGGPYDRWKARKTNNAPTLQFTGRLREAATGGAGSHSKATRSAMTLGVRDNAVPYAKDHHEGNAVESALFGRTVQLKKRPVIRFDGRPFREGQNGMGTGPRSFGRAVQQIAQAHVVAARRRALGLGTAASEATIQTILSQPTR